MEMVDLVTADDVVIGLAPRCCVHGNPALRHRTVHVVVMAADGRILLQKRSLTKDIQPGKWDTAVGGHIAHGEDYETAARREMHEELGLPSSLPLDYLFAMTVSNDIETENSRVYRVFSEGPFTMQAEELSDIRFWSWDDIDGAWGKGVFTPYLEHELTLLRQHLNKE